MSYPGFAILCFTAAAAGSFWLVISIFVHDYQTRKSFRASPNVSRSEIFAPEGPTLAGLGFG